MFWIISIFLMAVASLFVLFPLWEHYRPVKDSDGQIRTEINLNIFEDRQRELEADLANGNLEPKQFDSLLFELRKTLLIDTGSEAGKAPAKPKSKSGKQVPVKQEDVLNKLVPLVMALLIPLAAYFLYDQWGYLDDVELMDLYERTIASAENQEEASALASQLMAVVQEDEDNEWAWYFFGRNLVNLGMFQESELAFRRASDLMPEGPDKAATLGFYAQIKYVTSGSQLTDEVMAIIERALAINPAEFSTIQLLAMDAETNEDYQAAIGYWRLMIQANPNSQQAQELRNSITGAQRILAGQEGDSEQSGPRVEVNVRLADGLEFPPGLRVFVAARNAEREGMPPLAATDLLVRDLPTSVTLDNNLAVGPFNLSSVATVFITATVSLSGSATVQSGDYRVVSQNFAHNGEHSVIELIISDVVP